MRIGIIDLGTNSVRFDVYEQPELLGPVERLHREKLMVRLGEEVFRSGSICERAAARTLDALSSFRKTADALGVQRVIAVGTSAMRDATNGREFVSQVNKKTGIELQIISGEDEARLIAQGVLDNEPELANHFALVDIGGGSTEVSICTDHTLESVKSLNLGVARIEQNFLLHQPPERREIAQLRQHIQKLLQSEFPQNERHSVPYLVGSSGTARALAKLLRKSGEAEKNSFTRAALSKLVRKMLPLTSSELLELPGMEEKRVDLIVGGAVLLEEISLFFNAKMIRVTDFSLRDGLLLRELERARLDRTERPVTSERVAEGLRAISIRFGVKRRCADRTVEIAEALFDGLTSLHGLAPDFRRYLTTAALLCQMGRAIHPGHPLRHAAYLARHLQGIGLSNWERELIALLCEKKAGGKIKDKHLSEELSHVSRREMMKLLSLVRLTDALTPFFARVAAIREVSIDHRHVRIALGGKRNTNIELMRIEERRKLFTKLFGREVTVEPFVSA